MPSTSRALSLAVLAFAIAACAPIPTETGPESTRAAKRKAGNPAPTPTPEPDPEPAATATPAASAQAFFGRVLGADGQPVVGVPVRGFLLSNNGAGVISDRGASLIGNNAGNFRLLSTELATRTDENGHFKLVDGEGRPLNLEAVGADTLKAISFNVPADASGVTLRLAPTGTLTGRVLAPAGLGASDLTGVDVFVPGTAYSAKTDADGRFTIPEMPAGASYLLYATKRGLGRAIVKDVAVASESTASATLQLEVKPPTIASISPANGGPGLEVTITGEHFGHSEGKDFSVTFGGATATTPRRLDDQTMKVTVPAGATTGDVAVTVDGVAGAAKPFTVIKSLTTTTSIRDLAPGDRLSVSVVAKDSNGAVVANPTLSWSVTGTGLTVDASGRLSAQGAGTGALVAKSGTVELSHAVKVHDAPYVLTTLAGRNYTSPFDEGYEPVYEGVGEGMMFYQPWGLAPGSDGNLYVADLRGTLCRVTPDGAVTTFAGGGESGTASGMAGGTGREARFTEPAGIVATASGDFYVSDKTSIRFVTKGGVVTTVAGGAATGLVNGSGAEARFNKPRALTLGGDGNLYVADSANNAIRRVTPQGEVSTLATVTVPTGIALGSDGHLYVAAGGVYQVKLADGEVTEIAPESALKHEARGIAAGADGHLYVAETSGYVERVSPTGVVTTLAADGSYTSKKADGTGADAGMIYLYGILEVGAGTLYVTEWDYDYVTQRVRRLRLR